MADVVYTTIASPPPLPHTYAYISSNTLAAPWSPLPRARAPYFSSTPRSLNPSHSRGGRRRTAQHANGSAIAPLSPLLHPVHHEPAPGYITRSRAPAQTTPHQPPLPHSPTPPAPARRMGALPAPLRPRSLSRRALPRPRSTTANAATLSLFSLPCYLFSALPLTRTSLSLPGYPSGARRRSS